MSSVLEYMQAKNFVFDRSMFRHINHFHDVVRCLVIQLLDGIARFSRRVRRQRLALGWRQFLPRAILNRAACFTLIGRLKRETPSNGCISKERATPWKLLICAYRVIFCGSPNPCTSYLYFLRVIIRVSLANRYALFQASTLPLSIANWTCVLGKLAQFSNIFNIVPTLLPRIVMNTDGHEW
jgi:hypothetical protein